MPKLKPSEEKKQNDIIYLNIRSRCALFGCFTEEASSKKIGMVRTTFRNREKKGQWRSEELVYAAKALKVSVEWLVTDHSKVEEVT